MLTFCSIPAFTQTTSISGKVADEKGNGIPGATVIGKSSAANTVTDAEGIFKLTLPNSVKTLTVTSIGYADLDISIDSRTNIDVVLKIAGQSLSDVVVVGYGTARRKDVTGAIGTLGSKDFSPGVISNPLQQIQGKVSGLVITQGGGDPNANLIIRLRGQTSLSGGQTPLIVVDGIPLDDPNQVSSLPPSDISSYDILKDVSATAIYGSRGANGVIIINTKKGQAGKTRVEYNGYVSADRVANDFDLLTADEWREAVKTVPGINQSTIDGLDKGANTDWLKAITRTAYTHSHNLAVSGGGNGFNYRASLSYMNQDGIVINSGKEQIGMRFNAQQKAFNDKLDIQVSLFNNQNNRKYTDYAIFAYVNTTPPTYPVYNPDGSYFAYLDFEQQNPVTRQNLQVSNGKEFLTQLLARADFEVIKGLKVGVLGSISRFNVQSEFFRPNLPAVGNVNSASQTNSNVNSKKGDFHINYLKDFRKHSLSATAVYEYNRLLIII